MSRHACAESRLQTVTIGVLFLVSGIAVLTRARGWWRLENEWAYWPIGFVVPAVLALVAPRHERSLVTALSWFFATAVLIAWNLRYIHLQMRDIVPLVLVAIGLRLLYRASRERGAQS
jgi:uncharacterized membrane protein HdeD (DUF308 family)